MIPKKLIDFYKQTLKLRKYNNVVEAAHWGLTLRRFSGTTVFELKSRPGNRIVSRFSVTGFTSFIFWCSLYIYCTFIIYYEDQTVLRMLYNTKLKRYGDDFERCSAIMYVATAIVLTPFKLSGNSFMVQKIVDIDSMIEKTGDIIDYHKIARTTLKISLGQLVVYLIRLISIYVAMSSSIVMPLEKMFQVIYSDALAVITSSLFWYHLIILRDRFKWVNKTLREIKKRNSWEYKVFVRGKIPANMIKVVELQDKHVCEKIKTCARVYSMLFNTCMLTNTLFGLSLLFTMLHYFNYIILYLFYFMEATASGLFHDLKRYFDFLVYTFWEIAIAVGIIFLVVYFSESTVAQAKKTSYIIHQIINEDFSLSINNEAMQFSIQLIHEMPVFTVCGLFNLDYKFLQQGAWSVSTYLVILLQFVTENTPSV